MKKLKSSKLSWSIFIHDTRSITGMYNIRPEGPNVARGSFLFGPWGPKFCLFSLLPYENNIPHMVKNLHNIWSLNNQNFFFGLPWDLSCAPLFNILTRQKSPNISPSVITVPPPPPDLESWCRGSPPEVSNSRTFWPNSPELPLLSLNKHYMKNN